VICGILVVIGLLLFRKPAESPVITEKTIEKRIEAKEADVNNYYTTVNNEKQIVAAIHKEIEGLRAELERVKAQKDTFLIVQIQDTLINTLTAENTSLRTIINVQDSLIAAQRYIINSKDTIIAIYGQQVKKAKRQRNWAIAGGVIVGGGIIATGLILK
jgi:hypothetical protein